MWAWGYVFPLYFSILGCLKFGGEVASSIIAEGGWFWRLMIAFVIRFSEVSVIERASRFGNLNDFVRVEVGWRVLLMVLLESLLGLLQFSDNVINFFVGGVIAIGNCRCLRISHDDFEVVVVGRSNSSTT